MKNVDISITKAGQHVSGWGFSRSIISLDPNYTALSYWKLTDNHIF